MLAKCKVIKAETLRYAQSDSTKYNTAKDKILHSLRSFRMTAKSKQFKMKNG